MATYVNDLRLKEIATGDEAGTWGTSTNTNLSLVAEAFSFGTEAITTNADTHTTTLADGATDPGRSMFLKYTGTLDSTCTITIGPNTISKLWFIENATSGGFSIIIKQGSGATVTIANGQVKAIYSDGAGSGGAMVDAFQDLSIPDLFIDDDLTFTSDSAVISFGADADTTLTHTDGSGLTLNSTNKIMFNDASQFIQGSSATVLSLGATDEIDLTATAIDVNGTMDVSGNTTLGADVTFTGASANIVFDSSDNALEFADNAKSVFGTDSDMSLFHNGNNGFLDCDTGTLFIQTDSLSVKNSAGTEVQMLAAADGAVALYHNNAEKLATESTGINVTGTVTADGLTVDGSATITTADNTAQLVLKSTDADSSTGPILDLQRDSGSPADSDLIGFIRFRGDDDGGNVTNYATIQAQIADVTGGTEDGTLKFQTMVAGTVTTGLTIAGGNVGIGTSSPSTLVEASKSQNTVTDVKVTNANTGGAAQARFTLGNSGSNFGALGFLGGSFTTAGVFRQDGVYLFGNGAGGLSLVTGAAQPIYFAINSSEKMRLTTTGALGLGTDSPLGNMQIVTSTAGSVLNVNHNTGGSYPKASGIGLGATSTALSVSSDGSTVSFTGGAGLYAENTAASGNPTSLVFWTNATGSPAERMRIDSSGNAIFGSATANDSSSVTLRQDGTAHVNNAQFSNGNGSAGGTTPAIYSPASATLAISTNSAERLRMDGSGNLLVGRTSRLTGQVKSISSDTAMSVHGVLSQHQTNCGVFQYTSNALQIRAYGATSGTGNIQFKVGGGGDSADSEAARLTSNGTLLVGKTADDNSVGFKTNTSSTYMVASGQTPTFINRLVSDGDLLEFRKDSSTKVGAIGTVNNIMTIGSNDTGVIFNTDVDAIYPWNITTNAGRDGSVSLGIDTRRYKDLRLSGVMYSGSARIGTTSQQGTVTIDNEAVNTVLTLHQTSTSVNYAPLNIENEFVTGGSTGTMAFFKRADGTIVGSITSTITATSYATGSDQRLKENIADAADAGSKVDAIKVRQFDWKTDGSHQDYGMVAQELQSVAPEAVTENADSDDMMMVDYSKLVPMLIKEIQSLRARVAQLETEEAA